MVSADYRATHLAHGSRLTMPLHREKHARRACAYIVRDVATDELMLGQKLAAIASYINSECARNRYERVSARGLYEAADKSGG